MQSTQKQYIVHQSYAGHSDFQGSDKEYAICLAHVVEANADRDAEESPEAATWTVLAAFGKTGALGGGAPAAPTTRTKAERVYTQKVKEKSGPHHYTPMPGLPFEPYRRYFKVPLVFPEGTDQPEAVQDDPVTLPSSAIADPRYVGCQVVDITWGEFHGYIKNPGYGITEKEDGERCLIAFDGDHLRAYNRNGILLRVVPEAAKALAVLGVPFLIDGERLVGTERSGHFTAFALMEWRDQDIRSWSYETSISTLQQAMYDKKLLKQLRATPTVQEALENSTVEGLALLTPVVDEDASTACVAAVQSQRGEGYIIRRLSAPYSARNAVLKRKIRLDIDVFVYDIEPGDGGGSLRLGLRRPADNAVIACGRVRAGLTQSNMQWFAEELAAGRKPVITAEYLPHRAHKLAIVEGTTSIGRVRTDKTAFDCTTDQWGPEKADLVAQANPVPNISLP